MGSHHFCCSPISPIPSPPSFRIRLALRRISTCLIISAIVQVRLDEEQRLERRLWSEATAAYRRSQITNNILFVASLLAPILPPPLQFASLFVDPPPLPQPFHLLKLPPPRPHNIRGPRIHNARSIQPMPPNRRGLLRARFGDPGFGGLGGHGVCR